MKKNCLCIQIKFGSGLDPWASVHELITIKFVSKLNFLCKSSFIGDCEQLFIFIKVIIFYVIFCLLRAFNLPKYHLMRKEVHNALRYIIDQPCLPNALPPLFKKKKKKRSATGD